MTSNEARYAVAGPAYYGDMDCYSDMYKSMYGFRPTLRLGQTQGEWLRQWDVFIADYNDWWDCERRSAIAAQRELEEFLSAMQEDHGIDRATAIRWARDAEDFGDGETMLWLAERGVATSLSPQYQAAA